MKIKQILTLLVVIFLVSCSVQKRKYQKGFYVEKHHKSTSTKIAKDHSKKDKKPEVVILNTGDAPILASVEPFIAKNDQAQLVLNPRQEPDTCDVLLFRDGSELRAKIMESSSLEVKYKRCDNVNGPTYVTSKSELFMIKYQDGRREIVPETRGKESFNNENQSPFNNSQVNVNRNAKVFDRTAIVAFVLSIVSALSLFVSFEIVFLAPLLSITAAILAIVFAAKSMKRINNQPEVYRGKGLARAGLIIGIVVLSLIILFLFLLLLLILLFI